MRHELVKIFYQCKSHDVISVQQLLQIYIKFLLYQVLGDMKMPTFCYGNHWWNLAVLKGDVPHSCWISSLGKDGQKRKDLEG